MPSNATRQRIDWCPGDAAIQALECGEALFPTLNRQSVIDRLLIVGLAAYVGPHWQPPALLGTSRDKWRLPPELLDAVRNPGIARQQSGSTRSFPGIGSWQAPHDVQSRSKDPER